MTPKEKAIKILHTFDKEIYFTDKVNPKEIALICVDMIVESHKEWNTEQQEYCEYYENVKHELSLR